MEGSSVMKILKTKTDTSTAHSSLCGLTSSVEMSLIKEEKDKDRKHVLESSLLPRTWVYIS
jgi:hypothetical protein